MPVSHQKIKGFSLLEVMIAVFVLAIGLLGLAHLQVTTLQHNERANLRSQASALSSDIFDRMRANQIAAVAGDYNLGVDDDPPVALNTMAEIDISEWLANVNNFLPNGDGAINCNPCSRGAVYLVTLRWMEVQDDGARSMSEFSYSGAL
tara:strand:+ start:68520 stop:68966 length:447 start_codon:yes stop_codon:yes gene_type:complete